MPRKPRIEFTGAFYHVIVRGNQKQRIFKDDADYQKYLLTLTVYKNRTGSRIYAYVLMSNHVHLLIETGDVPLSKVMQGLNQTFTMYFNRRYRTVGHLFQGRYKAILCDREAYLLGLVKYIHQNPIRAKITERIDAYPWSSHHAYAGKNNPLGLVDADQVLRLFSENKSRARTKYREFMADQDVLSKATVYATIDQRLQGDDAFVERVMEEHDREEAQARQKRKGLDEIARAIEQEYEITVDDIRSNSRTPDLVRARRVFSQVASAVGHRGSVIAKYIRKDPAAITRQLRAGEQEREVRAMLKALEGNKSTNQA
ncbi:MAG: transposase [Nitrospirota bacterium]